MTATVLFLSAALLGQAGADAEAQAQQQREWLLAHLIVHQQFDGEKARLTQQMLDGMSASQLNTLVNVYKMQTEKVRQQDEASQRIAEQKALNDAELNLKRAEAYRDHLKREYQLRLLVKQQELEVMRRATTYAPFWQGVPVVAYGFPGYYARPFPRAYVHVRPHFHHRRWW